MIQVKRLILDVLKPHHPDVLEFARTVAAAGIDYRVNLKVVEMDDKTETLDLIIEGNEINFEEIVEIIKELGASLHSVDGVEVVNNSEDVE